MSQAFMKDTFAVVDLETTGTQRGKDNHIIQFGCALIKNLKIVKTYSFLINPKRDIPLAVQNLTGIHNEDVQKAKDFTYFAPKICKILKNTIFVAHNVNFDFPFLNYELVSHGFEALQNKAIDTVELAKIAFPCLPSYKLSDLTTQLQIKHLKPHQADSDAYGTAVLLLKIITKLESLPQATLNTLSSLSHGLLRDTADIFVEIATAARKKKRPLSDDLIQVRNLVLQKQTISAPMANRQEESSFPLAYQQKRSLFKGKINYRASQVKLINRLHDFIKDPEEKSMLVEAPSGTGKTFSYLFAYAYELYANRKLVIATPSKVLQSQIIEQEIPQMLDITKLNLTFQIIKSSSHYLDLDGFVQSLFAGSVNKPTLVLQMQILVWLTKTKTGDLDELQLTNYNAPLFAQISHPGDARVGSHFAEVDFWNLARQRQETADILVTNHAYLANHYNDTIWGQNPYLVVDEAHRFSDNVISSRNDSFQFESLWGVLSHLRNLLYYNDDNVLNQFGNDVQLNLLLEKLSPNIIKLVQAINNLQKILYDKKSEALSSNKLANGNLLLSFEGNVLFPTDSQFPVNLTRFAHLLEMVRQQTNEILFYLYQGKDSLLASSDLLLSELTEQIDHLDFYTEKSYQLADLLANKKSLESEGFIVSLTNPEDPLSANLQWLTLDPSDVLEEIYKRFTHPLFISATMMTNGNFDFIIKQLALTRKQPVKYISQDTFALEKRLEVLAVSNMPEFTQPGYNQALTKILTTELTNKRHILVLMTSLDKIREIFVTILNDPRLKDFEILAQGFSGSVSRMAKRFVISERAILLGADSFWEGVDFHRCGIDVVIVAKLPFASPDQVGVQLRQQKLHEKGIDPFENDSLPRALIRFRQGMGRLIRGEDDHGQFLVLDSRVWTKNYGQLFLQAIPVKINKVTLKELDGKLNDD